VEEPNDVLDEEHKAIELLLKAADGLAVRLRTEPAYPRKDLDAVATVITEFGDKCHHGKEERALFPALSAASPKVGAELARRLTSDHRAFRQIVGTMRGQIPAAEGSKGEREKLAKNLGTYAKLLREHIGVETKQLFPEVLRALPPAQRGEIAEAFERIEREEIGLGAHERYHGMIHALAETYAGQAG